MDTGIARPWCGSSVCCKSTSKKSSAATSGKVASEALAWGDCSASSAATSEAAAEDLVTDDLSRELYFYNMALSSVKSMFTAFQEKFQVPSSFVPLMVKGTALMGRVEARLTQQQETLEEAAKKRKERTLKKVSKKTQQTVLQDRAKSKKDLLRAIEDKKHDKGTTEQDWRHLVEADDQPQTGSKKRNGASNSRSPSAFEKRAKLTRNDRNEKYGYGGKTKNSGRAKKNTKQSTDDFSMKDINHGSRLFRRSPGGKAAGGAKGGIQKRIPGKPASTGGHKKGGNSNNRPGKQRRAQMRHKKN